MRPGTMVLTVTPDPATSAASVLAKPTSAPRRLFEITRLGIGATTPDDPMIRMRPHFFSIIVEILPPRADVRSGRTARGGSATVADQNIRPELAQFPFRGVDRRSILQIDGESVRAAVDLANVGQGLIEPRSLAPADRDFYLFLS